MSRLFTFDMDGTLLPNTTAMIQIAKIMGHTKELEELERLYFYQEIENTVFAKRVYELWQHLSADTVRDAFLKTPKIKNIKKTLKKIRADGGVSCLITASPNFFADHFYDYGFDHIYASQPFDLIEREFTPHLVLHAKDKPLLVDKLCDKLSFRFEDTIAFGDSISDVALFQNLIHTVSVNGDFHIKNYAKYHYTGLDLMEALSLVYQME